MNRPEEERGPSPLVTNLVIALLCLIWGSTWLVIKEGLRDLPPFTSAGARFTIAATGMAIVAGVFGRREGGSKPPLGLTLVMGTTNFAASYGLVYWSETVLPSGLVSVLWGVFPMMVAGVAHAYLPGERLRARQWVGFLLGFLGVVVLFLTDLRHLGPDAVPAGAILLLSPAVSAVGTACVKRHGARVSSLLLNRDGMILGALLLLLLAGGTERGAEVRWTRGAVASVLYLSLFGTVLSFGLYFWLLRFTAAYRMSLITYVTPVIALFLGAAFGQEPLGVERIAGACLILLGVAAVAITGSRVPKGRAAEPVSDGNPSELPGAA